MTADQFRTILADKLSQYGVPVYHALATPEDECPVLCWQETGSSHEAGDDRVIVDIVQIQLDLFTDAEYDKAPANLEAVLNSMPVSWYTDSQTYNPDRNEWTRTITVSFLGG